METGGERLVDGKPVADPAHGLHVPIAPIGGKQLAQPPNMDIDGPFFDVGVVAPHRVEQLSARVDAFRVHHEKMQQAKFRWTQLDRCAGDSDPVGPRVDMNFALIDRFPTRLVERSPRNSPG